MPLFEFKCPECGEVVEVLQKFDDPPPQHCEVNMERVLAGGRVGLEFKGDCWAKDGYTKKTKGKSNGTYKKSSNTTNKAR